MAVVDLCNACTWPLTPVCRSAVCVCVVTEAEDYKEKLKEVEEVCNPIIAAIYKSGDGPSAEGGDDLEDHDEL